jgi:hypothetical protein
MGRHGTLLMWLSVARLLSLEPPGYEFCVSGSSQAYSLLTDHVKCSELT